MIGILGGTFDPIHFGHIKPALELLDCFPLDEIRFIPCHIPPHRAAPHATPEQRWHMLTTVVNHQPGFRADDRELRREGVSYTADTLHELRAEIGSSESLCLIMGNDAFCTLHTWYRWREILTLAHILVVARPGTELPQEGPVADQLKCSRVASPQVLSGMPQGGILPCSLKLLDISSSAIRACIRAGERPRYMLPGAVWAYIKRLGLYGEGAVSQ